jgi:hypothetical protein
MEMRNSIGTLWFMNYYTLQDSLNTMGIMRPLSARLPQLRNYLSHQLFKECERKCFPVYLRNLGFVENVVTLGNAEECRSLKDVQNAQSHSLKGRHNQMAKPLTRE